MYFSYFFFIGMIFSAAAMISFTSLSASGSDGLSGAFMAIIATLGFRSRSVNWHATFLACGPLTVKVGKMPGRSSPSLAVDFGASGFWARAAPAANMAAAAAIQWQRRI